MFLRVPAAFATFFIVFFCNGQTFDIQTGTPVKSPRESRIQDYLYTNGDTMYFLGYNSYGWDADYFEPNKPSDESPMYFGKADYDMFIHKVSKTDFNHQGAYRLTTGFFTDKGKKFNFDVDKVQLFDSRGDEVTWMTANMLDGENNWLLRKKTRKDGALIEDWNRVLNIPGRDPKYGGGASFWRNASGNLGVSVFTRFGNEYWRNINFEYSPDIQLLSQKEVKVNVDFYKGSMLFSRDEGDKRMFVFESSNGIYFKQYNFSEAREMEESRVKLNPEGVILKNMRVVQDEAAGVIYLVGTYAEKKTHTVLSDGLVWIKFNYRNGGQVESRLTPFAPTFGKDNRNPGKSHQMWISYQLLGANKFQDGSVLYYFSGSRLDFTTFHAARFDENGEVSWIKFIGATEGDKHGALGLPFREFKNNELVTFIKTKSSALTAEMAKDARKGDPILMYVAIDKDGNRNAKTVFNYKEKKDLEYFRPAYIHHTEGSDYIFRFRNTKKTYQFGRIRVTK